MQVPPESGSYLFRCDLRDAIAREVCFTGRYEPQETALVSTILSPGMTLVDVGANWGYFTLLAASLVGPTGRVLSLEPDPRLYAALTFNIKLNALATVTALPTAAAERRGVLTLAGFDETQDNWGLSRLVDPTWVGAGGPRFDVAADSLDALLDEQEVDRVDLVKIDVEGAETIALRGMRRGLERQRYRHVILELHPTILADLGDGARGVLDTLAGAGYRGWWIDHSPSTNRRVAYRRPTDPRRLLRPVDPGDDGSGCPRDAWPHMLWLARDGRLPG
jgi:FkbM family methyltransferase